MNQKQAILYRYCLPMESGMVLRNQRLKKREGLLICLKQGAQQGWGEIAPLPGLSQETLEQAEYETKYIVSQWIKSNDDHVEMASSLPSVDFALSCAIAELMELLPKQSDFVTVPLCTGDPDELIEKLQAMPLPRIAKVKVGLYEVIRDGLMVKMLLEAVPDLHLRLDANRSWTLDKALRFTGYLTEELLSRIDFIEEPCRTIEGSCQFAEQSNMKIAWDESTRESEFDWQQIEVAAAVIIKPMLIGSLQQCQRLIELTQAKGKVAIISSSIESSLGLTQLARVADWLTPGQLPGLDTLSLMKFQLLRRWPDSPLPVLAESALTKIWQSC